MQQSFVGEGREAPRPGWRSPANFGVNSITDSTAGWTRQLTPTRIVAFVVPELSVINADLLISSDLVRANQTIATLFCDMRAGFILFIAILQFIVKKKGPRNYNLRLGVS